MPRNRLPRLRALAPTLLVAAITLAACGDDTKSGADSTTTAGAPTTTVAGAVALPEVELPSSLPTELVVTDLTKGTGPEAENGDIVEVRYVGVRSEDGTQFDENFTSGETFPVTLGRGSVIAGWDQGLIGAQAGGRRQLDIPADLAYGDSPRGDVIKAGDALTFVIDIVSVTPGVDLPDEPVVSIAPSANVPETVIVDLIAGDGAEAAAGTTVSIQLIAYRADTGEKIDSTWTTGSPIEFTLGSSEVLAGIEEGVTGMKVGGRRQITLPFEKAFGPDGSPELGLPAAVDLVLVIDLFSVA